MTFKLATWTITTTNITKIRSLIEPYVPERLSNFLFGLKLSDKLLFNLHFYRYKHWNLKTASNLNLNCTAKLRVSSEWIIGPCTPKPMLLSVHTSRRSILKCPNIIQISYLSVFLINTHQQQSNQKDVFLTKIAGERTQ